jgi:hypothetical protein
VTSHMSAPVELSERETSERHAIRPLGQISLGLMLLILPSIVYYVWFCLEFGHGHLLRPSIAMWQDFPRPTWTAATIAVGWLAFQALL